MRYFIPEINSASLISLLDHHPALFLTQDGMAFKEFSLLFCATIFIILLLIRYSIPEINSASLTLFFDHHPAVFLIQYGIVFSSSC